MCIFDFFSIIDDVAAISTSLGKNPFDVPSTLTRNFSPFSNRLPPSDVISDTIVSKSFLICLAMATRFIPNSKLIADDAKTGSFASTKIIFPSLFTELNFRLCSFRIFLILVINRGILFFANIEGNTTTNDFSLNLFSFLYPFIIYL